MGNFKKIVSYAVEIYMLLEKPRWNMSNTVGIKDVHELNVLEHYGNQTRGYKIASKRIKLIYLTDS